MDVRGRRADFGGRGGASLDGGCRKLDEGRERGALAISVAIF